MTLADLKVNPLFENLLPPLTDEAFVGLEEDILKQRRIIDPILVWSNGNYIIDGHNRYKILIAHKMDTSNITSLDFENESDVIEWIYNHQKNRRNLTRSELVHVWSEWEKKRAEEARERQRESGGDRKSANAKSLSSNLNEPIDPIRTAADVAKKMGVSENTYRDMKLIVESGSKEKIDRMNRGGRGNGVSTIAMEIKDGIPDGYRKCTRCGRVLKIDRFKRGEEEGTYRTFCKECYNASESERRSDKEKEESHTGNTFKEIRLPKGASVPRPGYYDTETPMQWTFDDVKVELNAVLTETVRQIKNIFNLHKNDVFSEDDSIFLYVKELRNFIDDVKKTEREINNARNRKEITTV